MDLQNWNDERLDRLALSVEQLTTDIQHLTADVQHLTADVQHLTADVQDFKVEMREGFAETRSNIAALTRLAQLHQDNIEGQQQQFNAAIARMDQAILELRAGQERQDTILDYLIRRDGYRQE